MNRFQKTKKDKSILYRLVLPLVAFAIIIAIFLQGTGNMQQNSLHQQHEALENALRKSIVHSYATEGFYPPSLDFIKERYKLTYNQDLFYVDYQPRGQNIMPEITIIQRGGDARD